MLKSNQVDDLIRCVAAMDREELLSELRRYRASFPIDFTSDFLRRQSVERLRHLFVALCLEQQRLPDFVASAA
jgi:hypothetical protein